jgi:uracil-DNA glycosylase family 4
VGDSPWVDEIREGRPFAGAAGWTLDRQLGLVAIDRRDVLVANTIWCKPLRLGWMDRAERYPDAEAAITHCRPNLDDLIERAGPKVLVPLGGVALRRVCGVSGLEGRTGHAGYVLPTAYGIDAVPTYHPAFVMRGQQKLTAAVLYAFARARSIANGDYRPSRYDLLLDPPLDEARAYLESAGPRIRSLVVDIETPESDRIDEEEIEQEGASWTIVRAGFSLRQGTAISFPFVEPYITLLQEALSRADEFVEHADNCFDSRRLRHAGLRLPRRIVSSMWAWHWLESDLRKGLGSVAPFYYAGPPWKTEAASRPAYYNAMDNAVTFDVYAGTRRTLEREGRWAAFERHSIAMSEPLRVMGERGLDIDPGHQAQFMARLEREWDEANAQLQAAVPDSVKPRRYWKRAPKNMEGVVELPSAAAMESPT